MSEKGISYLNRNFQDYQESLRNLMSKYYPQLDNTFDDASVGSWLIDLVAAVSDDLSYSIDRVYQETNLESAQEKSSLMSLARSNGLKIPGPKGAMTQVEFSCELPLNTNNGNQPSQINQPNWAFAPVIKKGTKLSSGQQIFEVMNDINFGEQFDENGISNRIILPKRNANGLIEKYIVKKTAVVIAGESKIYKKVIRSSDIVPFMEIILPDSNVMNVESIIFKDGTDYQSDPAINEFMYESEFTSSAYTFTKTDIYRYFEVDYLAQQYRWGDELNIDSTPKIYTYGYQVDDKVIPVSSVTKGEWKPLRQKFITEFTDKGYLKIIFGPGATAGRDNININNATDFAKYQIVNMISNDALGILPNANQTMYILYRVGGGEASNLAVGALNKIAYLNVEIGCISNDNDQRIVNAIRESIKVTNIIPSVSGKNMPSEGEIRNLIKYNNGAQDRCVAINDYKARIMQMPPKYGTPYRMGVIEENNKIMIYLLGIDYERHLTDVLPQVLVSNLETYLSEYRCINDAIEIKSGRIINLSFEVDVYINKNYNNNDVVLNIINTIKEYMNIEQHLMGEDIYIGDLEMQISKVDGVLNLIDLRVYNEYGSEYSKTQSTQPRVVPNLCELNNSLGGEEDTTADLDDRFQIDLDASDGILFSESDVMFEIKYPTKNISIRLKNR